MAAQDFSLFLGTGTTLEHFHSMGTLPLVRDRLKRRVKEGAISVATSFSMVADTPSGPVAFLGLSDFSCLVTSGTVQSKSKGNLSLDNCCKSSLASGGKEVLNVLAKNLLSKSAFSLLVCAETPL